MQLTTDITVKPDDYDPIDSLFDDIMEVIDESATRNPLSVLDIVGTLELIKFHIAMQPTSEVQ